MEEIFKNYQRKHKAYLKRRKQKQKQKQSNKWFSWGWIIFWLIVFWPMVFLYLLIKFGDKK